MNAILFIEHSNECLNNVQLRWFQKVVPLSGRCYPGGVLMEAHYCELCECVCVACVQLGGCDDCELKHPELLHDFEDPFTEALLDHFCL